MWVSRDYACGLITLVDRGWAPMKQLVQSRQMEALLISELLKIRLRPEAAKNPCILVGLQGDEYWIICR